jgi:hypothetical protein
VHWGAGGAGRTRRGAAGTRHARARAPRRLGARAASACVPRGAQRGWGPDVEVGRDAPRHARVRALERKRAGAVRCRPLGFHLTLFD